MRLADKLQEWCDSLGWEDVEMERDEDKKTSRINTSYNISNQAFSLWIETDEKRQWILLYLYAPFHVMPEKKMELAMVLNVINSNSMPGHFSFVNDGRIRYQHIIDVEDTDPSMEMISNLLRAADMLFEKNFNNIIAVALSDKTAEQILDELKASLSK